MRETRGKQARPSEILENPQTIGEHLKRERQKRKLYQRDVGQALGVSSFTIMNWEKGYDTPKHPALFPKIIAWLGYNPLPKPETKGSQLRHERLLLGLTSQQMADRLGIDQGTLLAREKA
jgi:transcriptional regulator with XRE-family HTH domain